MTHIGLLSDTHGYLDPAILNYFNEVDEIWHAGDLGRLSVLNKLKELEKPVRAVYGNIDDPEIRFATKETLIFSCEQIKVFMIHIGGRPGKYPRMIQDKLLEIQPMLFICGHSHILRVIYDNKFNTLYMNPGACGNQGTHHIRTIIRFSVDGDRIGKAEIIELGKRGYSGLLPGKD
jgi:putative phosphoesterase